jgi:hypothetical protein
MYSKIIVNFLVVLFFTACNQGTKVPSALVGNISTSQSSSQKDDLKNYLISKKINVESIAEVEGKPGLYEVQNAKRYFYIDQYKNIYFGTIIDLDSGKNISLSKRENKEVKIDISNGNLSPMAGAAPPMSALKSPADFDQAIQRLEQGMEKMKENIARLKEQKKNLNR